MGRWGALCLCLCLLTFQGVTAGKRALLPRGRGHPQVHVLEQMLLNASLGGPNLTLRTRSIQSLAFQLGCDFAGLSLGSAAAALKPLPQAGGHHAMQFPAELTRDACRTRPRELRLVCVYFFTDTFFKDDENSSLLNDYVLGARLSHGRVSDLADPVNISFWHNRSLEGYTVTCVFWKEGASERRWGAWSSEGCRTEQPSPSQVLCHCNHLTYFAVLMQLSQAPVPAALLLPLTYVSLVGCGVSIAASLLTGLLAAASAGERALHSRAWARSPASWPQGREQPAQGVLSLLSPSGLPRSWCCAPRCQSSAYGPTPSQQWANGTAFRNTSSECWVRSRLVHSVLVMGYGGLTSLFNLAVLAWALQALRRLRARVVVRGARACRDTVTVLGLTVLLGTTWALAFFSFGVFLLPQLFLFTTFNSLYGFFLFLWVCWQRRRAEAEARAEMEAGSSSQATP
uniref:Adhesion G protein-coupled receptor G5 n=1 Tax=Microcebus murinus TaxID=30608 RepID=A0A8C5VWX1_MICMU